MKVKVHYLFSMNKKIGSKIISWGTAHLDDVDKTPSHIAVLVNARWVFEATLFTGVRVIPYKKWLKINTEVKKIPLKRKINYSRIKKIFKTIKGKKYDWPGVLYLSYRIFLNKFFNKKIPPINKWENSDKYFCCEGVAILTRIGNYGMKTPIEMMVELDNKFTKK